MAKERQSPGDVLDALAAACGDARLSQDALSRLQHGGRFVNGGPAALCPPPKQKRAEQSQAEQRTGWNRPAGNLTDPRRQVRLILQ